LKSTMGIVKKKEINIVLLLLVLSVITGCREVNVPKPKGHFRIDLPQKEYRLFNKGENPEKDLPLSFEYPVYGDLSFDSDKAKKAGWFNIGFPRYGAKIYLTYRAINNDFEGLMEQTYKMNVKNHISKADAINEQVFNNPGNRVYGILYDLKGNTATAVQFYATDSINHYLRGSLYFNAEPNADSLAPVIDFFRKDIIHLVESLEWKK